MAYNNIYGGQGYNSTPEKKTSVIDIFMSAMQARAARAQATMAENQAEASKDYFAATNRFTNAQAADTEASAGYRRAMTESIETNQDLYKQLYSPEYISLIREMISPNVTETPKENNWDKNPGLLGIIQRKRERNKGLNMLGMYK